MEGVVVPAPGSDVVDDGRDFAHHRQQQRQGVVGYFLDAVIGHIDHHHAMFRRRRHIHTVITDPIAHHHFEVGQGGKNRAGDRGILIE